MIVFHWLNDQILKMNWLSDLVKLLVEKVFHLPVVDKTDHLTLTERIGGSIHFFIYDTIKIFILLMLLIFIVSYIQSYFPPERTKKLLGKVKGVKGNLLGALLGILTPFCSCSSIPIFIGFTSAGLSLGITFSFLIASPLIDLAAFLLIMSEIGVAVAFIYVIVGVILAVIGGFIIDHLHLENYVEGYVLDIKNNNSDESQSDGIFELTRKERLSYAKAQVVSIFKRVWLYILIGVGIGAGIHRWIPASALQSVIGNENPFSVLIAVIVGVPIYSDVVGTIPSAEALYHAGIGLGTVISFMMAVTALSLPSLIMLSKVIKRKLLLIFVAIVTSGIIIIGYFFNLFGYLFT